LRNKCLVLVLHFLIAGFSSPLPAQEHSYINYTVKDGLAGATVYAMAQDKDGFLWFGTETGLSRYDGTHFRNFYTTDGLPDNEIIKLFVDSRNRIWIIPFKNKVCYYQHGKIHNQDNDPLLRQLDIHSEVIAIIEDTAGNVLVADSGCIHVIAPNGGITDIKDIDGKPFLPVQAGITNKMQCRFLLGTRWGDIWADLDKDRLRLTGTLKSNEPNNSASTYISPQWETYLYKDSLIFRDTRDNTLSGIVMPKEFNNLSRINDSELTVNASSVTLLLDMAHHTIIDSFLQGQTVNGALQDTEGNLWFSTLGGGIHRLGSRDVQHYTFRLHNTVFPVFSINKVDGTLYVGTDRFYLWTSNDKGKSFRNSQIYDRFSRGRLIAIAPAGKKNILIGTDAGVFRLDRIGNRRELLWQRGASKALVVGDSSVLDCSSINARICRLRDGKVLDTVWNGRSTCGCLQKNIYYIGTLNGLYAISNKKISFLGEKFPVLKARISDIKAAPDGKLWIATYGEGLAIYKDNGLPSRITTDSGLTSNICRTLFIAGNIVWVGTDKGLDKVIPTDTGCSIVPFTMADGLSSDIINTVFVESKNVYAGTPDGLTSFNEDKISKQRPRCQLRIIGISIAGKDWPLDTTNFTLSHRDNDLQIEFAGISYRYAAAIRYQYRLSGLDENWRTTNQTSLHYPSLPAGTYDLQVFAINKFTKSSNICHIHFTIQKPYWEMGWFRLSLLLVIAALVWQFFRYRVKAIRKKEAEKTATAVQMAELEQAALRSRMNPHFIFNCLNSIQLYVMDKDTMGANEFITNFSRLIRQTLDISARSRISLREELDYLFTYMELERNRFENKFSFRIHLAPGIDPHAYTIPSMILQPYVENAIHHGVAHRDDKLGRIRIRIETDTDYLVCTIEDNGVGRKQASQYKRPGPFQYQSQGMELTAKRIGILNQTIQTPICIAIEDIEDHARQPAGTHAIIRFPIQQIKISS
jgi:ligand-binding sensor domain-containing protein